MVVDGDAWVLVEDEPQRGLGPGPRVGPPPRRRPAARPGRAGHRGARPPCRRPDVPDRGVARRRPPPAAGRPRAGRGAAGAGARPPRPRAHHRGRRSDAASSSTASSSGEVRGLEVCRVVDDPHTGAVRLEVGVGAHDREAFAIVHGDVPTTEALAGVVRAVAEHRGGRRAAAPARPPGARAPAALAPRAGPGLVGLHGGPPRRTAGAAPQPQGPGAVRRRRSSRRRPDRW